jgi:hypothetical protein
MMITIFNLTSDKKVQQRKKAIIRFLQIIRSKIKLFARKDGYSKRVPNCWLAGRLVI